ncbi:MAG: TetR/AcrR family transcriptional regulator [Actinobacteria bacterium]|nr:TetR/AcrR family transcriptional regulator [Actinomycetota bacterium]
MRPGRKRSEQSRLAILTAAYELIGDVGYARLTIEGIAARAGTGKQTIYRWWPSKADVILDALATKADLHIPIPDEGSYAADLRAFLLASFALGSQPSLIGILRALMAEAQIDPEFWRRFRDGFLQRRRDALGVITGRAQARGDLPPGLSPGTVADVVFGVIWYRVLATREPPGSELADELVTALAGPHLVAPHPVGPHPVEPHPVAPHPEATHPVAPHPRSRRRP